jgi:hypothetical protein
MKGREMMKRHKLFGSGVLVVAALLLVAIPASASAKPMVLQFIEENSEGELVPAPEGAVANIGINLNSCTSLSSGTLGKNPEKTVAIKASELKSTRCTEGASQTGYVEEASWSSKGKLKVKDDIKIAFPAPAGHSGVCEYAFTKFKEYEPLRLSFTPIVKGSTTGKLEKEASNKEKVEKVPVCGKSLTKSFIINAIDAEEEPFESELIEP